MYGLGAEVFSVRTSEETVEVTVETLLTELPSSTAGGSVTLAVFVIGNAEGIVASVVPFTVKVMKLVSGTAPEPVSAVKLAVVWAIVLPVPEVCVPQLAVPVEAHVQVTPVMLAGTASAMVMPVTGVAGPLFQTRNV